MKDTYIHPKTMGLIDKDAIEMVGIPSIVLMENAKNAIKNWIDQNTDYDKYIVVTGVGNNGGDGLALARDLYLDQKDVKVYIIGNIKNSTKDFEINLNILNNLEVDIINIKEKKDLEDLKSSITADTMIIDGIFGTGLSRDVEGLYKDAIEIINQSKGYVLSIDIPSGINAETGDIMGVAVDADTLLTLQLPKLFLKNYQKEYQVLDIGIPKLSIQRVLKAQK